MQFYSDFAGARYLKYTNGSIAIEIDFGIGHIMDNGKVMAAGKCDNILEESTIRAGCGWIIGIIQPEQAGFSQHILRNTGQIGKIIIALQ
jgi:hypothetical protein